MTAGLLGILVIDHPAVKLFATSAGIAEVLGAGGDAEHYGHDLVTVRWAQRILAAQKSPVWEPLHLSGERVSSRRTIRLTGSS